MIEFLLLYKWAWMAAMFGGAALALIGAHMAARNQAVQTLVISQGASLGVVIALAFTHMHGLEAERALAFWPSLIGLATAALMYVFCETAIPKRWPSRNTYFVSIFAILLAITDLVISLVPSLESHMVSSFFGDISVASNFEAQLIALMGLGALVFTMGTWNGIVKNSFEQVIFRQTHQSAADRRRQFLFLAVTLIIITACVQFLGLLFTLSCLFIPPMILSRAQCHLRGLATKIVIASMTGVTVGLGLSLWNGKLPTSPTLTLALLLISLMLGLVGRGR
jgi:ABC-type Mn2+/Zn2+ transport system permease subunit